MAAHAFWSKDLSVACIALEDARGDFAQAKRSGALLAPPESDEELRPWIARACYALDLEALQALGARAGVDAFGLGVSQRRLAWRAASAGAVPEPQLWDESLWATRELSAWHLALMVHGGRGRGEEVVDFLMEHPSSRQAIARSPCPEAIANASPSLAELKAWTKRVPGLGAAAPGGLNLAQCLARIPRRAQWSKCLSFARAGVELRELLTQGSPSAMEMMLAGPAPPWGEELPQAIEKTAAFLAAMELRQATKKPLKKAAKPRGL